MDFEWGNGSNTHLHFREVILVTGANVVGMELRLET